MLKWNCFKESFLERSWMEAEGWLQGSLVSLEHTKIMTAHFDVLREDILLVVASQSCDIANCDEKDIEFSIAERIDKLDGNLAFNKNPRILHIPAYIKEHDATVSEIYLKLVASEKVCISKEELLSLNVHKPCKSMSLKKDILNNYVDWLAARYKRPALPSEFDRRVDQAWERKKREKAFVKLSEYIKGIYVEISPFGEIEEDDEYSINLLVLIVDEAKGDEAIFRGIKSLINDYINAMKTVKINTTTSKIEIESLVSLGSFNRYKRVNFDRLSYRNNHPLPPEV